MKTVLCQVDTASARARSGIALRDEFKVDSCSADRSPVTDPNRDTNTPYAAG
jgi:hypothetical protein